MREQKTVNYLYFFLFFLLLSFMHAYQVFLIESESLLHRFFYIVYAIGQCFLEVGILLLIADYLVKRFPRSLNRVFISLTFLLFLIHIIDFPLVRMMDMSIWYGLDCMSAESFENFIEILHASNISLRTWMMAGAVTLLIPIIGVLFFWLTNAIVKKRPLSLSYPGVALTLLSITLFLSLFDFKTGRVASPEQHQRYLKALPWKTTLFHASHPLLPLPHTLKRGMEEPEVLQQIASSTTIPLRKPNIFLFVIESLREDFLTPTVAPSMAKFRSENITFDLSFSSANATHLSWFSIFQARYPFYWEKMQPSLWSSGSVPLRLLKKAGYKIHAYSSSRFEFYQMDEILFGRRKELVDCLNLFAYDDSSETHENDAHCFEHLFTDMKRFEQEEGHLFLIFLEATHFDYSWPKRDSLQFTPIVDRIDYFKVACSTENVEGIKNRYRNAIFYLDSLFGGFLKRLKMMKKGEESVVVLTGDHGEEFFEEGAIFHASTLSVMQTHVPIYFRFGTLSRPIFFHRQMVSHVDIFPTLLDHVFGVPPPEGLFDGESLFREQQRPFAIAARYNASRSPYEFYIHNGTHKCLARFFNQRNIFQARSLQILNKKNLKEESVPFTIASLEEEFKPALDAIFVE